MTKDMNTVIKYNEFVELPFDEQVNLMTHWRNIYKVSEIKSIMGTHTVKYYQLLNKLGIKANKILRNVEKVEEIVSNELDDSTTLSVSAVTDDRFKFSLKEVMDGNTFSSKLEKLAILFNEDNESYDVEVKIVKANV